MHNQEKIKTKCNIISQKERIIVSHTRKGKRSSSGRSSPKSNIAKISSSSLSMVLPQFGEVSTEECGEEI